MKNNFLTFLVLLCMQSLGQEVPALKITPLTGNYYVYTTWNTFKGTPFPSNSLYVVTDSGVVLIDTPWDTSQTLPLLDSIFRKHHKKVIACFSTHSHADRTAGLGQLHQLGIPTYSGIKTWLLLGEEREREREREIVQTTHYFTTDTLFRFGEIQLETFYPGPGHTPDNIVIWFPDASILYGGCFIKSTEAESLGNLADADVKAWPASLHRVMKKYPSPRFVIPGHQNWENNQSPQYTLDLLKAAKKSSGKK